MPECNICGGTAFAPGPGGRLSRSRLAPLCLGCRSLERHRAARAMLANLRCAQRFRAYTALQLSADASVSADWFFSCTVSSYGGANSIDLEVEHETLPVHDVVLCTHVIEHVADPVAALRLLTRMVSERGLLVLSYPDPVARAKTLDWGFADASQHGHYREFGRDFEASYALAAEDLAVFRITTRDPATGDEDLLYVLTRSRFWAARLVERWPAALCVQQGRGVTGCAPTAPVPR